MIEKLQSNQPLVDAKGHMTPVTAEIMEKLMRKIAELEARIEVLEP